MNFDIFGCNIRIDLMGVLEILILYLLAFLFIRFVLLSRLAMHLKLFIGLFVLAVIMLEILGTTFSDSNLFIIKYRNIIYIGAFVIFFSIFQPELRHFILNAFTLYKNRHLSPIGVCQIADFLKPLQKEKLGALIVVQNSISVEPYISSYIEIDAKLSTEMLLSIFSKSSILHDGAVVVIGDRIKYAKVFFKFVDSQIPDNRLGARHRAGIYISEQTDAEVFVVSEERNIISHCKNGILTELTI